MKKLFKTLGILLYVAIFIIVMLIVIKVTFWLSLIIAGLLFYLIFPYWKKLRDWTEKTFN